MSVLQLILVCLLLTALSSCATVLNQDTVDASITFDTTIRLLTVDGIEHTGGDITVRRSARPLRIEAISRNDTALHYLQPQNSPAYNLNWFYTLGIGYLMEADSPRRWTYPVYTHLSMRNGELKVGRLPDKPRGKVDLHFGLPYVNVFEMDRPDGRSSTGFIGIEVGAHYYYDDNANLSLHYGGAMDFFVPMGPVMILGPWRSTSIEYADLRMNWLTDHMEFGAGLSYANMNWKIIQDTTLKAAPRDAQTLFGSSIMAGYRIGEYGRIGLVYHPYFLRLDRGIEMNYAHHISLGWSVAFGMARL